MPHQETTNPITIGLVLDFFNPKILDGAHAYTEEHGINLDARWSVRGDWTPQKPGWDGVIYGVVDDEKLRKRINRWKIPKVSLIPHPNDDWQVIPDYTQCGILAANELVQSGATSLFSPIVSDRIIDQQFTLGVSQLAREKDIPYHIITTHQPSFNKLLEALVPSIQSYSYPLGFCQPHAGLAYSLQKRLLEQGTRIPEDVLMSVIDKDIQRTPSLAPVPLTTIELDEWHRGFVAAEMAHRIISDDPPPQHQVIIPPKDVTRRASTGYTQVRDRVVATALSYVRNHYLNPIGVSEVVAAVGASRRVVEMRFRKTLNRGIHEELTRLRIEEAKRQILNKDLSITNIAEKCGFSSVHYFSAAFKREIGLSPKQFQKQSL